MITVPVDLGERSYRIVIGENALDQAGEEIASEFAGRRCVVVSDTVVADLYMDRLTRSLSKAGFQAGEIRLPPGEQSKSFAQLEDLLDQLQEARIARDDFVIALGGGVIGDLTGFAAAVLRRGISFVQVPTTLLSQVDSSVGGKTGINSRYGKNLIGSFHQPRLVLADTGVLDTLPPRQLLAGYAETVKYALIGDPDFFTWLEENGPALISGDSQARAHAIATSCRMKAELVKADEREAGVRALLNLGHTFGHAFEAETGYSDRLLHGEAVAIGTVIAFDLSVDLGLCPPADATRVRNHFKAVGLPIAPPGHNSPWSSDRLIQHMGQDKKVSGGRMTFILVRGIGEAFVTQDVETNRVANVLDRAIATVQS